MVLPLLVGLAARGIATRAGAGMLGRTAALNAGQFGGAALQRGVQNRHNAKQDVGASQWVKQNPGEAAVTATYAMMRGSTLRDNAAASTSDILQSTQFH